MCAINPETQCGRRERELDVDGSRLFFRSGYPCVLPKDHTGEHRSCDGTWLPENSLPVEPEPKPRLYLVTP